MYPAESERCQLAVDGWFGSRRGIGQRLSAICCGGSVGFSLLFGQ